MEKNLKLTISDGYIIEMESIQSMHDLIDDEIFSYLLRLYSRTDTDSLTPTEWRYPIERACRAGAERAGTGKEPLKTRKKDPSDKSILFYGDLYFSRLKKEMVIERPWRAFLTT